MLPSETHAREKELENEVERLRSILERARTDLASEKSLHANSVGHAEELMKELDLIKGRCSELEEQRKILLSERDGLK